MATLQSFKSNNNFSSRQAIRGLIAEKKENAVSTKNCVIARISTATNANLSVQNADLLRQWHIAMPPTINNTPPDTLAVVGQVLPR